MSTLHRAAAVRVRAACPQELWWGHVPAHEGLWLVPGAAVKLVLFSWQHGGIMSGCQEASPSTSQLSGTGAGSTDLS